MSEPREWFLRDGGPGFQAIGIVVRGPEFEGHEHVVEYSAYDAAIARAEKAAKERDRAIEAVNMFRNQDRLRGYPTGEEWCELIRKAREALEQTRRGES